MSLNHTKYDLCSLRVFGRGVQENLLSWHPPCRRIDGFDSNETSHTLHCTFFREKQLLHACNSHGNKHNKHLLDLKIPTRKKRQDLPSRITAGAMKVTSSSLPLNGGSKGNHQQTKSNLKNTPQTAHCLSGSQPRITKSFENEPRAKPLHPRHHGFSVVVPPSPPAPLGCGSRNRYQNGLPW